MPKEFDHSNVEVVDSEPAEDSDSNSGSDSSSSSNSGSRGYRTVNEIANENSSDNDSGSSSNSSSSSSSDGPDVVLSDVVGEDGYRLTQDQLEERLAEGDTEDLEPANQTSQSAVEDSVENINQQTGLNREAPSQRERNQQTALEDIATTTEGERQADVNLSGFQTQDGRQLTEEEVRNRIEQGNVDSLELGPAARTSRSAKIQSRRNRQRNRNNEQQEVSRQTSTSETERSGPDLVDQGTDVAEGFFETGGEIAKAGVDIGQAGFERIEDITGFTVGEVDTPAIGIPGTDLEIDIDNLAEGRADVKGEADEFFGDVTELGLQTMQAGEEVGDTVREVGEERGAFEEAFDFNRLSVTNPGQAHMALADEAIETSVDTLDAATEEDFEAGERIKDLPEDTLKGLTTGAATGGTQAAGFFTAGAGSIGQLGIDATEDPGETFWRWSEGTAQFASMAGGQFADDPVSFVSQEAGEEVAEAAVGGALFGGIGIAAGAAPTLTPETEVEPETQTEGAPEPDPEAETQNFEIEVSQGENLNRLDASTAEVDQEGNIIDGQDISRIGEIQGVDTGDQTVFQSEQPWMTALVRNPDTGEVEQIFAGRASTIGISEDGSAEGLSEVQALRIDEEGEIGNLGDSNRQIVDFQIEAEEEGRNEILTIEREDGSEFRLEEIQSEIEGTVGAEEILGRTETAQTVDTNIGREVQTESVAADPEDNFQFGEDIEPATADDGNIQEVRTNIDGEEVAQFIDTEQFRQDIGQLDINTETGEISEPGTESNPEPEADFMESEGPVSRLESEGTILNEEQLDTDVTTIIDADQRFGNGEDLDPQISEEQLRDLQDAAQDIFGQTETQDNQLDVDDIDPEPIDTEVESGDQVLELEQGGSTGSPETTAEQDPGIGIDQVNREAFETVVRGEAESELQPETELSPDVEASVPTTEVEPFQDQRQDPLEEQAPGQELQPEQEIDQIQEPELDVGQRIDHIIDQEQRPREAEPTFQPEPEPEPPTMDRTRSPDNESDPFLGEPRTAEEEERRGAGTRVAPSLDAVLSGTEGELDEDQQFTGLETRPVDPDKVDDIFP